MTNKKNSKNKKKEKVKKSSILRRETKKSIVAVLCFALAAVSVLSFLGKAGAFGGIWLKISRLLFGKGIFLAPLAFGLVGLAIVTSRFRLAGERHSVFGPALLGTFLFVLTVLGFFHIFGVGDNKTGGWLGLIIGFPLMRYLGFWAALIVLLALLIISVLVAFNFSLLRKAAPGQTKNETEAVQQPINQTNETAKEEIKTGLLGRLKARALERFRRGESERTAENPTEQKDHFIGQPDVKTEDAKAEAKEKKTSVVSGLIGKASLIKNNGKGESANRPAGWRTDFKMPPLDFLEQDKGKPTSGDIKANINVIKRTLENFGIEVEMAEVNIGPTVTQYTLRPAQGVKLVKITALQNDLALALAAHPIRIEAPIPGRSLVGIEIPNKAVVTVRLRSLLERPAFKEAVSSLIFAVGRDVAGSPIYADLAKMPHLLVAGATGTGKTIALNNFIVSLLYRNSPQTLKLILIDPKRVELSAYAAIPHLLTPVIVQPDKAIGALRWAVGEMERRFSLLQEHGRRDIGAYLTSFKEETGQERLPYIVVVIDELADLMASHGREAEGAIVRLAQMARAVGIHLVVSTQRPSVEVITGLIKANITTRMSFQVASQVDSRTILDMAGAEKLLGNGDMLFLSAASAKPRRVQGAYVSEKEVKKVADYLRSLSGPKYQDNLSPDAERDSLPRKLAAGFEDIAAATDDELFNEAKVVVVQAGKASASLLQRRLRIGYARAARLIDILEEQGVVGPADGARARDVFIDEGEKMNLE